MSTKLVGGETFDEAAYLAEHDDVARAVSLGSFESGYDHFLKCGRKEGRRIGSGARLAPPGSDGLARSPENFNRRDRALAGLDLNKMSGMEIGALDKPLVERGEGQIFYVDFADAEYSRAKYAEESAVRTDKIVNVDGIWGLQTLSECVRGERFDYVLASHVVEHVPDLITWLDEIASVLNESGQIRLIVPDKRFTFDRMRPESQIYDVLEAYVERRRAPSSRTIIEYHTLGRHIDSRAVWDGRMQDASAVSSTIHGYHLAADARREGKYEDTHCWVFTPAFLVKLFKGMADLEMIQFSCAHIIPTQKYEIEFFVHLKKESDKRVVRASWDLLSKTIRD